MVSKNKADGLRRRARKYLGSKCQNCGYNKQENLEIHHIIPIVEGGRNNKENLMTLCNHCHKRLHGTDKKKQPEYYTKRIELIREKYFNVHE